MIKCCVLATSKKCKSGAQTPIFLFQLFMPLLSGGLENGRGYIKNVQSERSNQEHEEDGSHGSKIEQRVV